MSRTYTCAVVATQALPQQVITRSRNISTSPTSYGYAIAELVAGCCSNAHAHSRITAWYGALLQLLPGDKTLMLGLKDKHDSEWVNKLTWPPVSSRSISLSKVISALFNIPILTYQFRKTVIISNTVIIFISLFISSSVPPDLFNSVWRCIHLCK